MNRMICLFTLYGYLNTEENYSPYNRSKLTEIEIPEDHIHAIIRCVSRISPSDIMRILKSISAKAVFQSIS